MMTIMWALSKCKESVKKFSLTGGGVGEKELPAYCTGNARKNDLLWNAILLRPVRSSKGMLLSFTGTILICCCCYKAYPESEFQTPASQSYWNCFFWE